MIAVAGTLLNQTQGRVLLNALLPRGDGNKRKKAAPVVGSAADGSPVRSFSPLITKVNAGLRSWAETDTSRRVGARYFFFRTIALLHCRRTRLAASGRAVSFISPTVPSHSAGGRVSGRGRAISSFTFRPHCLGVSRRTRRAASGSSTAAARFGAGSTTCSAS